MDPLWLLALVWIQMTAPTDSSVGEAKLLVMPWAEGRSAMAPPLGSTEFSIRELECPWRTSANTSTPRLPEAYFHLLIEPWPRSSLGNNP